MDKVMRVLIPVRVTKEGKWAAYGWGGREGVEDEDLKYAAETTADMMGESDPDSEHVVYVSAWVPIPEVKHVDGTVVVPTPETRP